VICTQVGPGKGVHLFLCPPCLWLDRFRESESRTGKRERNVFLLFLLFASVVPLLSPDRGAVPFTLPNCRDRGCRRR
jgi:hypothetical protein